ncbi:MAG: sugar phosphate nucleotidyltransferase [Candidatus Eisenbacteria bacterium]
MRALILAGGEGSRLAPLTGGLPKCLVAVQGRPFVEHQIELFRAQGLVDFVLCVGVSADAIQKALGQGDRLGVSISYSVEMIPLGTAGAVKNASRFVESSFLCANGDTLVEFSLSQMIERHAETEALITILTKEVSDASGKGTVLTAEDGRVVSFVEKSVAAGAAQVNCGVYVVEKEVLNSIPAGKQVSLETETFPRLLGKGARLFSFATTGTFLDIGTPEQYLAVKEKGWRQ